MMLAHRFICDVNDTRALIGPCFLVTSPWCQIRNPCRVQPFPLAHMVISLQLHIHSFLRLSFRALWLAIHSAPLEQCWPTSFWLRIRWIDICDYRQLGMGEMKLGGGFEGYNRTITLGPMSSVTVVAVVQCLRCDIKGKGIRFIVLYPPKCSHDLPPLAGTEHTETISIPRGIFQSNWQHIAHTL